MLTKNAIGNMHNRYVAVLKKCRLLNVFGSLAMATSLALGGIMAGPYLGDAWAEDYEDLSITDYSDSQHIQNGDHTYANVTISGTSGDEGSITVSGGTLTATDTTTVNSYGLLEVSGGTYNADGDTKVDSTGSLKVTSARTTLQAKPSPYLAVRFRYLLQRT